MKKILIGIIILIGILFVFYHELIIYGLRQGHGQLKVIRGAVPVADYLENPSVPDSIKQKLLLIAEVREYAVNDLGINPSENYTTIFDQKGKPILWNVSACLPYELKAYRWKFPFLGSFSYKGYFNYDLALSEEKRLKEMGLDTRVREVGGWSTLGWFKDPVLSNMLSYGKGSLTELIIHELTHGTLYVKDSVEFNENLATFIGQKGAVMFLDKKYGKNSFELKQYQQTEADHERFIDHMLRGADELEKLYENISSLEIEEKERKKSKKILEIVSQLDTISFNNPDRFQFREMPNNAYFMAILRYRSKTDIFEIELKNRFNGNLKEYLNFLKEEYPSL
jgi:predicted aminopeptidase